MSPVLRTATLISLLLLAGALAVLATRGGIGVSPDSTNYLAIREYPDPGHGPLVRWIHAAMGFFIEDRVGCSRWFFVGTLLANIALIHHLLVRRCESPLLPGLGALFCLTSTPVLTAHLIVTSEPLYLLLGLLGLYWLVLYLEGHVTRWLLLAAAAIGLACLTRLIGVSLIAAGGLSLLLLGQRSVRRRLIYGFVFGVIAAAPLGIFLLNNILNYGSATTREMGVRSAIGVDRLTAVTHSLAHFLLPQQPGILRSVRVPLLGISVVVVGVLFFLHWRRARIEPLDARDSAFCGRRLDAMPTVLGLYVVCYTGVYLVSLLVEPGLSLDSRMWVPLYPAAVILTLLLIDRVALVPGRGTLVRFFVLALLIGYAVLGAARATRLTIDGYREGFVFSSRSWRQSALVQRVRALAPTAPIYTNEIEGLFYLTGRKVESIPWKLSPRTGRDNTEYDDQLRLMVEDVGRNNGAVVYFDTLHPRTFLPTEDELKLHLNVQERMEDGWIFFVDD